MVVLLVEDRDEEIEQAKEVLKTFGFKSAIAKDLYNALRLLEQHSPVIEGIITDIHFPEGYEPGRWPDKILHKFTVLPSFMVWL